MIPTAAATRQDLSVGKCCTFDDPKQFISRPEKHLIFDGRYFQSFKYFNHIRLKIRELLKPKDQIFQKAECLLPERHRNDFIICPHIRRGDFQTDDFHQPTDPKFTRAATDFLVDYYRKSHPRVTVAVFGNDVKFVYEVFKDLLDTINLPRKYSVVLTPTLAPEIDLAFTRKFCDVTLITAPSSTFGWWLSYLSKEGSVTYYRNIQETQDKVANEMKEEDFYPPEWIKLRYDNVTGRIDTFF
ncbi:hypothetical protein GCK72_015785 [Caenorhabditis remanei]|nr:hypothetical protein GCK72_015785 [Caenorhabditis remanei]KAF1759320.1 hypothetical protein GCK72_015785 [Caenorhabditis remanei]